MTEMAEMAEMISSYFKYCIEKYPVFAPFSSKPAHGTLSFYFITLFLGYLRLFFSILTPKPCSVGFKVKCCLSYLRMHKYIEDIHQFICLLNRVVRV